jgi:hypothetical protein
VLLKLLVSAPSRNDVAFDGCFVVGGCFGLGFGAGGFSDWGFVAGGCFLRSSSQARQLL